MENNFDQSDVIEIDIVELMGVLLKKLWIIILGVVVAGSAAFLISAYVMTPKYTSVTKIYIINRQSTETLTYSDLQSGTQLTKDYQALVTSRPVMDEVIAGLGLPYDVEQLRKMITVEIPTDTRIVSITVESASPTLSRDIANAVRTSASSHIENVMNTEAVNVVEDANLPTEASSPNVIKNTAIGGIGGFLFAVALIVIIYIMDDSIKNPDDVENYLKLSVLGSIPDMSDAAKRDKKGKKKRKADEETRRDSAYRAEASNKLSREKGFDDGDGGKKSNKNDIPVRSRTDAGDVSRRRKADMSRKPEPGRSSDPGRNPAPARTPSSENKPDPNRNPDPYRGTDPYRNPRNDGKSDVRPPRSVR